MSEHPSCPRCGSDLSYVKKQLSLIIASCSDCPYAYEGSNGDWICKGKKVSKPLNLGGELKTIIELPVNEVLSGPGLCNRLGIPIWCPLPNFFSDTMKDKL